jgi:hypothetical protein
MIMLLALLAFVPIEIAVTRSQRFKTLTRAGRSQRALLAAKRILTVLDVRSLPPLFFQRAAIILFFALAWPTWRV